MLSRRRKGKDVSTFAMAMLFIFPCPCPSGGGHSEGKEAPEGRDSGPPPGRNARHAHLRRAGEALPGARAAGGARAAEPPVQPLRRKSRLCYRAGGAFPAHDGGALRRLRLAPCRGPQSGGKRGQSPRAARRAHTERAHTFFSGPRASLRATGQLGRRRGARPPRRRHSQVLRSA